MNLESVAASRALEFSLELGFECLKDDSPSLASFGLLIRDAQLFANGFNGIRFSHVKRDGNFIVHNLTCMSCYWFICLNGGCSTSFL